MYRYVQPRDQGCWAGCYAARMSKNRGQLCYPIEELTNRFGDLACCNKFVFMSIRNVILKQFINKSVIKLDRNIEKFKIEENCELKLMMNTSSWRCSGYPESWPAQRLLWFLAAAIYYSKKKSKIKLKTCQIGQHTFLMVIGFKYFRKFEITTKFLNGEIKILHVSTMLLALFIASCAKLFNVRPGP